MNSFCVMGNPISHSKSPDVHQLFARQTQQVLTYVPILVEPFNLAWELAEFQAQSGSGANITAPFKHEAYTLVDKHTERAKQSKTVNTIKFHPDGTREGDNTDGVGLLRDLTINQGVAIENKRILLVGAGGAIHGIIHALLEQNPAKVIIANRTTEKAIAITRKFSKETPVAAHDLIQLADYRYDLVINGTTTVPNLPSGILNPGATCYDLAYGKEKSPFLQWATKQGALCLTGLGMLVEQAAESYYFWLNIRPNTKDVISSLCA